MKCENVMRFSIGKVCTLGSITLCVNKEEKENKKWFAGVRPAASCVILAKKLTGSVKAALQLKSSTDTCDRATLRRPMRLPEHDPSGYPRRATFRRRMRRGIPAPPYFQHSSPCKDGSVIYLCNANFRSGEWDTRTNLLFSHALHGLYKVCWNVNSAR